MDKIIDGLKLNLLFNMRTGDPVIDMILSSLIAALISFIFSQWTTLIALISISKYRAWINNKMYSTIVIEGKQTFRSSPWSTNNYNLWGKRFDAIWDFINNETNYKGINNLKEMTCDTRDDDDDDDDDDKPKHKLDKEIYIVSDNSDAFPLTDTINVKVSFSNNSSASDKIIETCGLVDIIRLEIYSNVLSINELKAYIDNLTLKFLDKIEKQRNGKIFIYSLQSSKSSDDDKSNNNWMERPFRSTRNFDNLYFDGKQNLIEKIDFFINNKDWYEREGHPYTLGIGLSGKPGTGKTSIIKCLANKLKRHLIQIPLNKVKTESDFYKYYFESTYNRKNMTNTVDFEHKIIVLEDIDCMSDIILDRSIKKIDDMNHIAVPTVNNKSDVNNNKGSLFIEDKDKLTLSFILNLIDGLDENYGRILIITSNCYNKIDPALVRPGRIDLRIEMKKASLETIQNMYNHYYQEIIPDDSLAKIKDDTVSPAELVNYYRTTNSSTEFLTAVIEHCSE
jgi:hypothetical protein